METIKTQAALAANIAAHGAELAALFGCHDIAVEMEREEDARFTAIAERILAENDFRFPEDNRRLGVRKGDRILRDDDTFLMTKDDIERYFKLTSEANHAAGLTDAEGYYTSDIRKVRCQAYSAVVDFIIGRILPEEMRKPFRDNRMNTVQMDKLIAIIRPAVLKNNPKKQIQ